MKLNAAKLPLLSFRAKFHCASRNETVELGRSFAAVVMLENRDLEKEPVRSIGVIAPQRTGKSALLAGIHECLEDGYDLKNMATLTLEGVNDNVSEKGGLVRHFDLCVNPNRKYYACAIRSNHRILTQGLNQAGLELVEHANILASPRFDYIFRLRAQNGNSRTVSVYTSDELADEPAFQKFLDDHKGHRAKPFHYALDIIDHLYPGRDV